MREFTDEEDRLWHAIAIDAVVAHGRPGARLAFVPADLPDAEPIRSNLTFNSRKAADLALGAIGEAEIRRRLALARTTA